MWEAVTVGSFQNSYVSRCPSILEKSKREKKAQKILAVLRDFLAGKEMAQMRCLDLGCSAGIMSKVFAREFGIVVGIDVDEPALAYARRSDSPGNMLLLEGDACELPFESSVFDVVISAQVYEHVRDAGKLVAEIRRVLRPEGVCFFSGPNWLFPWEAHYAFPFLHWLPRNVASLLLRLTHRGTSYEEKSMTYWQLKSMLGGFDICDFTIHLVKNPDRYQLADEPLIHAVKRIPNGVLKQMILLMPNYNFVLQKRKPNGVRG